MERKNVVFCYEGHPILTANLTGGNIDYKRMREALETEHEVTTLPDLATTLEYSRKTELADYFDFAVLHVPREFNDRTRFSAAFFRSDERTPEQQAEYELIGYRNSLDLMKSIRGAQPKMKVILYRNHKPRVLQACIDEKLIDFYTRARRNGVATIDDEIGYIQRCIAGQINPGVGESDF